MQTNLQINIIIILNFPTLLYEQALLWGNCIKALTGWYHPSQKTTMFGLWGTCTFAGGIVGTSLAVSETTFCFKNDLISIRSSWI